MDPDVVTNVIDILKGLFGELTVTRGKKHNFLGMDLTFCQDKTIKIEMKKMLNETLDMIDDDLCVKVSSPETKRLFDVREKAEPLNDEKSELFHSIVAKLLYLCKRSRPDVEPVVAFICTRVSKSDVEGLKTLIRVLSFFKQTIDDPRIIGAKSQQTCFRG